VTRALKGVAGVNDVRVDLGAKQAVVSHSGANIEKLKGAVDDAGYEVVGVE
jgi:copper chaperone CopZ